MLNELQQHYESLYQHLSATAAEKEPDFVKELRKQGMQQFVTQGLPTHRDEAWKYTRTQPLQVHYPLMQHQTHQQPLLEQQNVQLLQWADCYQLYFIDGTYSSTLSDPLANELVTARSLAEIMTDQKIDHTLLRNYFGQLLKSNEPSFTPLNHALWQDGVYLAVKANVHLDKPIHIVMLTTAQAHEHYMPMRVFVHLAEYSHATIIQHHVNLDPKETNQYFAHTLSEILLNQHAHLEHIIIVDENPNALHLTTTAVHQEVNSQLSTKTLNFSGQLIRNEIMTALFGTHAQAELHGLFIGKDKQHIDNHTLVHHIAADTTSLQFYKGILTDTAHGAFTGKIIVNKEAQNTSAKQYNKNLVLSPRAEMSTRPQLEIYALDVACAHGATVGTIDQDMLFYLQARGIDKQQAQELLLVAFAQESLEVIKHESVRAHCQSRLVEQLTAVAIAGV